MRTLFLLAILALVAGSWIGGRVMHDAGYVLLAYDRWTVETSLWVAAVALLLGMVVFYLLANLVLGVVRLRKTVPQWLQESRLARSNRNIADGMYKFASGRWKAARKLLVRSAEDSRMPMINYLVAAWAADRQGDHRARDRLLTEAREHVGEDDLPVGITEVQILKERGRWEAAEDRLRELRDRHPDHPWLVRLSGEVFRATGNWEALGGLLPELRRHKACSEDELRALEKAVYLALLAPPEGPVEVDPVDRLRVINDLWSSLPVNLHRETELVATYARHLMELDAGARAEIVLRNALKRRWRNDLVRLYGLVRGEDVGRQLEIAEQWLQKHPNNAVLLLTLGRLSLQNELWGKARKYLEASLGLIKSPETFCELGRLLEFLGERQSAERCYRAGLRRVSGALAPVEFPEGRGVAQQEAAGS